MKKIFKTHQWEIIQDGFDNSVNEIAESVTSIANGHFGFRGNFEEDFTGETLKGTYIAGVYYPDKTKVGWWKNGYPEYFAKILNACDFLSIHVKINNTLVDVNKLQVENFTRVLNMKNGDLIREFEITLDDGTKAKLRSQRFVSMSDKEIGAIKYSITPINKDADIYISSCINGDVRNKDSNYDEMFWNIDSLLADDHLSCVTLRTKKTDFWVSSAVSSHVLLGDNEISCSSTTSALGACSQFSAKVEANQTITLYKYFAVTTSRDYNKELVQQKALDSVNRAHNIGFNDMYESHVDAWNEIWSHSDIKIVGDEEAQQGIRFNIFHMNQTYTGKDSRLNIGPKGFTGEKYGGSTYWDTEAYCVPFFLSTAHEEVSRNLLIYRYNHLRKAKENAAKLGLKGALYPMVTMNGEECHNEWEITFEEIHRNAAITYAIYNYVNYTGDESYLPEYGIYVLYETSRFWVSRINYNKKKQKYMILGVTGPNEYENNINNNYHTNRMCAFSLHYTVDAVSLVKEKYPESYAKALNSLHISEGEMAKFKEIADNMYYPYIDEQHIYAQQDGFMDKDIVPASELLPSDRPLNQRWSWDRILRSCYIKQADVLQSIYNLPNEYTLDEKRRHFDFYEPITVHESSLSPCIYSIIACEVGYLEKGYELYLRASRLDLDNYNNDTEDGLHITSMAGTWMSIVHGFGGLRVCDDILHLNPIIPNAWNEYSFNMYFRKTTLNVSVTKSSIKIRIVSGNALEIFLFGEKHFITDSKEIRI